AVQPGLRLVQFVGPVQRAWLDQLQDVGFELIGYVPSNGYLVNGDARAIARLHLLAQAAPTGSFLQWSGPFADSYKIHPALASPDCDMTQEVSIAVQFARSPSLASQSRKDIKVVKGLAASVIGDSYDVLSLTNLRLKVDPRQVPAIARLASVINIEPWTPPRL